MTTPAELNLAAEMRAIEAAGLTARQWANFCALVAPPDANGCARWRGAHNDGGYGKYHGAGAHRTAYAVLVGPIPAGLTIDHVRARGCRWRDCMNVAHMEVVTNRVNTLRGDAVTAVNARKTECRHGHPYNEANTYWHLRGGHWVRGCRACRLVIDLRRKAANMVKRHARVECSHGHSWPAYRRTRVDGRVYCHLCQVEAGASHGR